MDWAQVLAIVLPVMFAIIIGIFYNNRRIDDLRSDMNLRFSDVNQRFTELHQTMGQNFTNLNQQIREIRTMLMEFLKKEVGL